MSAKKSAINVDMIRQLAELLTETDLSEIEVEEDDLRIRLARGGTMMAMPAPMMAAPAAAAAPGAPATQASAATAAPEPAAASGNEDGKAVPSPMVGTAYHSPAPGAEAFVQVGQKVKKGQTIMIVEAMKTMNQISSPADGTVKAICVEDGQPVEYGETLITLG